MNIETTITIFKAVAMISVIVSVLFVLLRTYVCYIKKVEDDCFGCDCKVDNKQKEEVKEVPSPVALPTRKQVKKRVSAIVDDKLVFTKVSELPEKKKPGRKKKEL